MSLSLQVIYPVAEGTTFDYDYYFGTHLPLVGNAIGEHIESSLVTKGIAGGPGVPAGFYLIATLVFADQAAMDGAMSKMGVAVGDIPNFTNTEPAILIGEVAA
ncbi:MAG: EthD family reductase [Alphaproteobacteria bacterium]|jgi:uncharacterized protein (TIGR02118 family)|nr:EthD family reductase [Alphaproteobacteria bacterium]